MQKMHGSFFKLKIYSAYRGLLLFLFIRIEHAENRLEPICLSRFEKRLAKWEKLTYNERRNQR